jgi:hypothetical protein
LNAGAGPGGGAGKQPAPRHRSRSTRLTSNVFVRGTYYCFYYYYSRTRGSVVESESGCADAGVAKPE